MTENNIPKIKKVNEIGENLFRVIKNTEKILQGWAKRRKKMVYLFKGDSGQWAYYDKDSKTVIDVTHWEDKKAFIFGEWVEMSLYYRLHVAFEIPIEFSVFSEGRNQKQRTYEAIINLSKSAFELLEAQMSGRDPNSFYRFGYKKLKKGDSVDSVIWVK